MLGAIPNRDLHKTVLRVIQDERRGSWSIDFSLVEGCFWVINIQVPPADPVHGVRLFIWSEAFRQKSTCAWGRKSALCLATIWGEEWYTTCISIHFHLPLFESWSIESFRSRYPKALFHCNFIPSKIIQNIFIEILCQSNLSVGHWFCKCECIHSCPGDRKMRTHHFTNLYLTSHAAVGHWRRRHECFQRTLGYFCWVYIQTESWNIIRGFQHAQLKGHLKWRSNCLLIHKNSVQELIQQDFRPEKESGVKLLGYSTPQQESEVSAKIIESLLKIKFEQRECSKNFLPQLPHLED